MRIVLLPNLLSLYIEAKDQQWVVIVEICQSIIPYVFSNTNLPHCGSYAQFTCKKNRRYCLHIIGDSYKLKTDMFCYYYWRWNGEVFRIFLLHVTYHTPQRIQHRDCTPNVPNLVPWWKSFWNLSRCIILCAGCSSLNHQECHKWLSLWVLDL